MQLKKIIDTAIFRVPRFHAALCVMMREIIFGALKLLPDLTNEPKLNLRFMSTLAEGLLRTNAWDVC